MKQNKMQSLKKLLAGGDLRSIGKSVSIISKIKDRQSFDKLLAFLFRTDWLIVMRAADAIEKISSRHPEFLAPHKEALLRLLYVAENKELKWHLALMMPRLQLKNGDFKYTWYQLCDWARDKEESKPVRVAAVQGLYEMSKQKPGAAEELDALMLQLETEHIPSVNTRIRNIRKELVCSS